MNHPKSYHPSHTQPSSEYDESMAAAMCSYMAIRMPELKQVKIEDNDGEISIELIFDEEYRKQVAVDFTGLH